MARITKADLDQLVTIIKTRTGDDGYFIEYASGRPRLYLGVGDLGMRASGRVREMSPRLTARELSYWLDGFIEGIEADVEVAEEKVYDNPSYRGYYIYPDLARRSWFIQKSGFHIATETSEEEAQRTVDDLLDE